MYRNESEIMGNVSFGNDTYYPEHDFYNQSEMITGLKHVDPYLPIENEPMGSDYSVTNFDSSDICHYNGKNTGKNNDNKCGNNSSVKVYNYNPLTYKTNSRSYLDSWNSINYNSLNEYFDQKNKNAKKPSKPINKKNNKNYQEKLEHLQNLKKIKNNENFTDFSSISNSVSNIASGDNVILFILLVSLIIIIAVVFKLFNTISELNQLILSINKQNNLPPKV